MRLHIITESLKVNSVLKGTVGLDNPKGSSNKMVIGIHELLNMCLPVMSPDNLKDYHNSFNFDMLSRYGKSFEIDFYLLIGTTTDSVEQIILNGIKYWSNEMEIVEHYPDYKIYHTPTSITKVSAKHPEKPIEYLLYEWMFQYKLSRLTAYVPTYDTNLKDEEPPLGLPVEFQLIPPELNKPLKLSISNVILNYTELSITTVDTLSNKLIVWRL